MQLTHLAVLALLSATLVGCDDDDPIGPGDAAMVRIINAASGTADVDVTASGSTSLLADNLNFRSFTSSCVAVPAGSQQTLTFRQGTTTLATRNFTFEEGLTYTIVLSTNGTNRVVNVLEDDETVAAGNRAVRFLNASASAGDAYLFATGASPGTPIVEDLAVLGAGTGASAWFTRPQNQVEVRFFDPNAPTTGTPRGQLTLGTPSGRRMQSVIFTEAGSPAGATAWVVGSC